MEEGALTCDVCKKELAAGVYASSLGPASMAYGPECLRQRAEPLELCHLVLDLNGLELGRRRLEGDGVRSYQDGRYIDWPDIVRLWRATKKR